MQLVFGPRSDQWTDLCFFFLWHISLWHNFCTGSNKDKYVNSEWYFLKFICGCSFITFRQHETTYRHQMRSRTIVLSYWCPFVKHLKPKYSGHIKEADLHFPRKKSRSDQSLLPGTFCLFQKNFSRSPGTLIWVLRIPCPTQISYPILCVSVSAILTHCWCLLYYTVC